MRTALIAWPVGSVGLVAAWCGTCAARHALHRLRDRLWLRRTERDAVRELAWCTHLGDVR